MTDAASFGAEAARQRHAEAHAAAAAAAKDPAQDEAFPSLGSTAATTSKRRLKFTEMKLAQVLAAWQQCQMMQIMLSYTSRRSATEHYFNKSVCDISCAVLRALALLMTSSGIEFTLRTLRLRTILPQKPVPIASS